MDFKEKHTANLDEALDIAGMYLFIVKRLLGKNSVRKASAYIFVGIFFSCNNKQFDLVLRLIIQIHI